MKRPGFTLIELIIVIAIIAIVVSAVFVALNPVQRLNDARNARAKQDAVAIDKAIQLYMVENGQLPASAFPGGTVPTSTIALEVCDPDTPGTTCFNPTFLVDEGYLPAVNPTAVATEGVTGFTITYTQGAYTGITAPVIASGGGGSTSVVSRPIAAGFVQTWSTCHWTNVDEPILAPAAGDYQSGENTFGGSCSQGGIGENPPGSNDFLEQKFPLSNPSLNASQIIVSVLGRRFSPNGTIRLIVGGVPTVAQPTQFVQVATPAEATWTTYTFNGNWTTSQLASGFEVGVITGDMASSFTLFEVDTIYATVTGTTP